MGEKLSSERTKAVQLAIADIIAAHAKAHDRPPTTVQLGEWFGVTQQKMSAYAKDGVVGTKLADGVADHLKTTIDGLVQRYLQKGEPVRAGDIQGWRQAVAEAKRGAGELADTLKWDEAAHVVLPVAPSVATAAFAYDLAHLLTKHAQASGFMRRVAVGKK